MGGVGQGAHRDLVCDEGNRHYARLDCRTGVGTGEAQVQAVKAGHGVAQLATWMIGDALRTGELVDVLPALATAGLPVSLIWPRHRRHLPKVDAMLAFLTRELGTVCQAA
ncbi:hypothetical protein DIE18_17005 [Burkholderia sp. Bp9125]|nr:hypothetical protein DIE18_17005 [Burkholderia sp. Bp9125]